MSKWLRRTAREAFSEAPVLVVLSIGLSVFASVAPVALAALLKALTAAIQQGDARSSLAVVAGAVLAAEVFAEGAGASSRLAASERTLIRLDIRLLRALTRVPRSSEFEDPEFLNALSLLEQQRNALTGIPERVVLALGVGLHVVLATVVLFVTQPAFIILPIAALPGVWAERRRAREAQRAMRECMNEIRLSNEFFLLSTDDVTVRDSKIYNWGTIFRGRHRALRRVADELQDASLRRSTALVLGAAAVYAAAYAAAVVWATARAVRGSGAAGDVILIALLGQQVGAQVSNAANVWAGLASSRQAADVYWTVVSHCDDLHEASIGTAGLPDRMNVGIRIENVSFRYSEDRPFVLDDVTLDIPAGATVALVGPNGAGKSTLVKLLLRLYEPTAGRLTCDGIPLSAVDPEAWRSRSTVVFQDFERFALTVRACVGFGDLRRLDDDTAIAAALARSGSSLAQGDLQRQLGKEFDGIELSGGQWQRTAIARGLMRADALLAAVDEPNAQLDAHAEEQILQNVAEAAAALKQRTGGITVLVTHRLPIVSLADLIVVMDGGRVVEAGSHAELLTRRGLYWELYTSQSKGYLLDAGNSTDSP